MAAPLPPNEEARLQNLYKYDILDTGSDPRFDEIVELASTICETPVSQISLIDKDRLYYKADKGTGMTESPRKDGFCSHTILGNDILEIEDLSIDPRFKENPYVKNDPYAKYYAGVPLITKEGFNIGALCVIDVKTQKLNDTQRRALQILGNRAVNLIELHLELEKSKKQQLQQEKDLKFKDKILSILSHDLRMPLNSIFSTLKMAEEEIITEEELAQFRKLLLKEIEGTQNLLDNILQWSTLHIEGKKTELKSYPLDKMVDESIELLNIQILKKELKIDSTKVQGKVFGHNEMIKLVIRNILTNAIKYSSNKGNIWIWSETEGDKIHLSIKDNGLGMKKEQLNRLQNRKGGISQRGTNGERGTGIGMLLAQEFLEINKGDLKVTSASGKGSTFTLILPKG